MKDEDIFKRLKKETPLVKRKDIQPLSTKDFAPKRSAFDMLVEKTNDKREERMGGYRTKPGSYQKSDSHAADEAKQGRLSLYGDASRSDSERVQRPQPRTIQARSETRIRSEAEPVRRTEVRTIAAQPYNPPRTEPERTSRPESRTAAAQPYNPARTEVERTPRPESRTIAAQPTKPQSAEPNVRTESRATAPQPHTPPAEETVRMEISMPHEESPALEYAQPVRSRMSSIRDAYTRAEEDELEIFSEATPKRKSRIRTDAPAMAPMRQARTEFEEYYEPAQETEEKPAFRHELKFYINYTEYILLRNTLKALAQLDKYAGESGEYFIRSLYFDDVYESALFEKLGGSDYRKKYRVRIYNFSDDVIKFEKKIKQGQFVTKKSINLSRDEYDRILTGECEFLLRRSEPLAQELFLELKNNRLSPRVIVDYVREAYVYPFENIRITFDKDLRSGMWLSDIFDPKAPTMPMYEEGTMVLEVKFEKSLPAHIRGVLGNIQSAQRSAISKYVICRKYE